MLVMPSWTAACLHAVAGEWSCSRIVRCVLLCCCCCRTVAPPTRRRGVLRLHSGAVPTRPLFLQRRRRQQQHTTNNMHRIQQTIGQLLPEQQQQRQQQQQQVSSSSSRQTNSQCAAGASRPSVRPSVRSHRCRSCACLLLQACSSSTAGAASVPFESTVVTASGTVNPVRWNGWGFKDTEFYFDHGALTGHAHGKQRVRVNGRRKD